MPYPLTWWMATVAVCNGAYYPYPVPHYTPDRGHISVRSCFGRCYGASGSRAPTGDPTAPTSSASCLHTRTKLNGPAFVRLQQRECPLCPITSCRYEPTQKIGRLGVPQGYSGWNRTNTSLQDKQGERGAGREGAEPPTHLAQSLPCYPPIQAWGATNGFSLENQYNRGPSDYTQTGNGSLGG